MGVDLPFFTSLIFFLVSSDKVLPFIASLIFFLVSSDKVLPFLASLIFVTSFYKGNSYSKFDAYYEDQEHDDNLTAEDYDRKAYQRDGWEDVKYDRQYW